MIVRLTLCLTMAVSHAPTVLRIISTQQLAVCMDAVCYALLATVLTLDCASGAFQQPHYSTFTVCQPSTLTVEQSTSFTIVPSATPPSSREALTEHKTVAFGRTAMEEAVWFLI